MLPLLGLRLCLGGGPEYLDPGAVPEGVVPQVASPAVEAGNPVCKLDVRSMPELVVVPFDELGFLLRAD